VLPTLDFTWNQFWSFWSPKNNHFDHLSSSEFWIFGYFWHLQVCYFQTKTKFKASKIVKWQFLALWNQPKLISRKIRVAGKFVNFNTVEYIQSKFPIRLLQISSKMNNFNGLILSQNQNLSLLRILEFSLLNNWFLSPAIELYQNFWSLNPSKIQILAILNGLSRFGALKKTR